jgi:F1F0 ATPase subunit 2
LRTGVVMSGFYFVMGDSWQRLLSGLLGFVLARMIVIRLTRVTEPANLLAQEADHAP